MAVYTPIDDSGSFMNTVLYTGTGSSNAITGVGFQPDWTWIKNRTTSYSYQLYDSERGVTKTIASDSTSAESTNTNGLTAFGADGFTVGSDVGVNANTQSIVSWNWKAGTTSGITLGGASITPTSYSFNQTAGFSIIKYVGNGVTGATIPHGLGVAPSFIIIKNISEDARQWDLYSHRANGGVDPADYYYEFSTNGALDDAGVWDDTLPTANLITLGSANRVNENTKTMIAYCFTDVSGYSKFGSYIGNGNADGTFCFTGFKPAFLLTKQSSSHGEGWQVYDSKRLGYNPDNNSFYANKDYAEGTADYLDLVSNGFKVRHSNNVINGSGRRYIYMAFAESPLVNSNGVPNNAR